MDFQKAKFIDRWAGVPLCFFLSLFEALRKRIFPRPKTVVPQSILFFGLSEIVVFGPEAPLLYGPLNENHTVITGDLFCSPCFSPFNNRTSIYKNNVCMKDITVDEVLEAVKRKVCTGWPTLCG